ncbi:hypothetical protein N2152v2_008688 [Parachlorella kessleri]
MTGTLQCAVCGKRTTKQQQQQRLLLYRLAHGFLPPPETGTLRPATVTRVLADAAANASMERRLEAEKRQGRDFYAQLQHVPAGQPQTIWDAPHLIKCPPRSARPSVLTALAARRAGGQDTGPEGDTAGAAGAEDVVDTGAEAAPMAGSSTDAANRKRKRALDPDAVRRGMELAQAVHHLQKQRATMDAVQLAGMQVQPPTLPASLEGSFRTAVETAAFGSGFRAMDESGSNSAQRTLDLGKQQLVARRLLGNLLHLPHETVPAMIGGYTGGVVMAAALNPLARLRLVDSLPANRRSSLNERAMSSDSVEGVNAEIHGQMGFLPDPVMLLGHSANIDWRARVRAMPAAERGFNLPAASRVYACREDETAASAERWNDARVLYPGEERQRWEANWAKKLGRKADGAAFTTIRNVHKTMR